jgi:hypothetical protein
MWLLQLLSLLWILQLLGLLYLLQRLSIMWLLWVCSSYGCCGFYDHFGYACA